MAARRIFVVSAIFILYMLLFLVQSCVKLHIKVQGRSEGVLGGGGVVNPPTFLELTYSENRVGHSENYGNNSITKF